MATTTLKPSSTSAFPASAVESQLRSSLLESVKATAALHSIVLPSTLAGQFAAPVRLDSLCVVELLCEIEPTVGFELKDSIVKSGGYQSVDEAISHLIPRIETAWQKHEKGAKK